MSSTLLNPIAPFTLLVLLLCTFSCAHYEPMKKVNSPISSMAPSSIEHDFRRSPAHSDDGKASFFCLDRSRQREEELSRSLDRNCDPSGSVSFFRSPSEELLYCCVAKPSR